MDVSWISIAVAAATGFAGAASAYAAFVLSKNQKRAERGDAMLRVAERLESPDFRAYRRTIYGLDRGDYKRWNKSERGAVDAWCAQMDVVATLIRGNQIDRGLYLDLFGDVTFRTAYQVAPYCIEQAGIRGQQFLLPMRLVTFELIKLWRRRASRRRYPMTIGFPSQPALKVNPDLFAGDVAMTSFLINRRFPR